jgi:hypothetical protein
MGLYNFACIRYPPPLEQRRSCKTDIFASPKTEAMIPRQAASPWLFSRLQTTLRLNVRGRECPAPLERAIL